VLVATLATLLLRALDRPSAPRWIAYGASLALLGYVDVVALSVVAGHVAGAVLRSWYQGDRRLLWFLPAVAGWQPAFRWSWRVRRRPGARSRGFRGPTST
jgi:mannosyltransferase